MYKLRQFCADATHHGVLEALTADQLVDTIHLLKDAGLLLIPDDYFGGDFWDSSFRMGVQMEDVEIALETTLFQESFYQKLRIYVQQNDFDNE